MDSRLLQLADSAFPTGAFVHSFGIEALWQLGLLQPSPAEADPDATLALRLRELTWHTAHGALPFLNDAGVKDPLEADRACHAFLSNHVANRASRAQGQSFLLAAEATFELPGISALRSGLPHGHSPVAIGAGLAAAGFAVEQARQLFLFGAVRSAVSAAVRLGIVGPLRAQRLLFECHPVIDEALAATRALGADDACSVSPLIETAQSAQDRLYSRLFQS